MDDERRPGNFRFRPVSPLPGAVVCLVSLACAMVFGIFLVCPYGMSCPAGGKLK